VAAPRGPTEGPPPLITIRSLRGESIGLRILLAEDNPINQRLAQRLLERQGHRVSIAHNGRQVLDALLKEPFDVLLMDLQMPEMDGLEATVAIREREKLTGGHIPIIAMTAHSMKGDRERCLGLGMDGYVSKPINAIELLRQIEQARLSCAE
jgi:two-component system, sensor histidine kinase and response regulator